MEIDPNCYCLYDAEGNIVYRYPSCPGNHLL
jgi:hypothetical protein